MKRWLPFLVAAAMVAGSAFLYSQAYRLGGMSYDEWYANAHMLMAGAIALLGSSWSAHGRWATEETDGLRPPGSAPTSRQKRTGGILVIALASVAFLVMAVGAYMEIGVLHPREGGLQMWVLAGCSLLLIGNAAFLGLAR